jgi:colanic acid/amylovoran biosynthesis protein
MNDTEPIGLCLFGAPADTGNLGVSALGESVVRGLQAAGRPIDLTVFDHGWGVRQDAARGVRLIGARDSRRLHRPESWRRMNVEAVLGRSGNPGLEAMRGAAAILDISGGDSFTDLYGPKRFRSIAAPKRMAIRLHRPLVLLPQTYGPFREARARARATSILRSSAAVWSRDAASADVVRELLGVDHDPTRHRTGVDVAFALPPDEPPASLRARIDQWQARPLVGLNVSGLLYNDSEAAGQYGLRVDYRAAVHEIAARLLRQGAHVVLVPHVFSPGGRGESDVSASLGVRDAVAGLGPIDIIEEPMTAGGAKWLISQLDWFCGTRMHATIAALSSQVPVAAVAYSAKTSGVFATCGQAGWVIDARSETTGALVDAVLASYDDREATRASLRVAIPPVVAAARAQLTEIVDDLAGDGLGGMLPR